MFVGYNFEPRSKNHVLANVSLVMTIGLSVNRWTRTKKKQFDARKQEVQAAAT